MTPRPSKKRANVGVVAKQVCPHCKTPINAAAEYEGATVAPVEGDWTVCYNCCTPLVFDRYLTARLIPPEVWRSMDTEDKAVIEAVQERLRADHRAG